MKKKPQKTNKQKNLESKLKKVNSTFPNLKNN